MIDTMQSAPCTSQLTSESPREGRRYRGLPRAEVERLAALIAEGDCEARNLLVKANLGLVRQVARRYVGRGLSIDDLVGEGNLGLIRAAEEFDPSVGASFSTYATYWIKQSIQSAVMNTATTIRVPAHVFRLLIRWKRIEQSLGLANGRPPSFEEVASHMGLSEHQRLLIIKARHARDLRLESVLSGGGRPWSSATTRDGLATPTDPIEADEERSCLHEWLCRLDGRERAVLILRYGLGDEPPLKLNEIGRRLGLSREWVRKLADQALRKLLDGSAARQGGVSGDGPRSTKPLRSKAREPRPKTSRSTVGLKPEIEPASFDDHLTKYVPDAVPPPGQEGAGLALCG
jgi:RNA polymerase primary sigma factor